MNRRSFLRGLGIGLLTLNSLTGIKGLIGSLNPPPRLLVDNIFQDDPLLSYLRLEATYVEAMQSRPEPGLTLISMPE